MIAGKSFRLIGSLMVLMALSSSAAFAAETAGEGIQSAIVYFKSFSESEFNKINS